MSEFMYICEYLGVSPSQFFDENISSPALANQLYNLTKNMPEEDINVLISTAKQLNKKINI